MKVREAVKCGFGDLRLLVENEEMKTFKFVLYVCNETFRRILDDPLFEEPLELSDECTKESFLLLERYYEGIEIEITDKNCVEFLSICVCYNEKRIIQTISDYIISHLNVNIMIDLLDKKQILRDEYLKELKEEFEDFLKNENYKLIHKDFMNYLSIDNIEYIFSIGIKFNGSEIDLLRLFIDYYQYNVNDLNEKEKEELKNVIERCKFDLTTFNSLNEGEKEAMNDLKISLNEKEKYSIRYYSIPKINNAFFYDFLMHYYPEEDIQEISFNMSLKKEKDVETDIEKLLKENNIKLIMLVLQIQDSLYIEFNPQKYPLVLDLLFDNYKKTNNEEKQKLLLKHIVKFILKDDKIFDKMKEKCGIEILFYLFKYANVVLNPKRYTLLMNYIHQDRLNDDECKILDSIIEDEKTKKMIKYHELKSISYGRSYNDYTVGDEILLQPTIDDINDVEEITIEGNGLTFDSKSGIISGITKEDCDKRFEIKVKNCLNEISYEIHLFILDKIRFDGSNLEEYSKLDNLEKTFTICDSRYHHWYCRIKCYLNVKLEKGIYHFIFLNNAREFRIGANEKESSNKTFYWNIKEIECYNGKKCEFESYTINNSNIEAIFDMNKRTFSIKDIDGKIHTIITDFEGILTPYVEIKEGYCKLLKAWIE